MDFFGGGNRQDAENAKEERKRISNKVKESFVCVLV
jgi:hypothetical protein